MDTKKTTQFDKYTDDTILTMFGSKTYIHTHDMAIILIENFSIIILPHVSLLDKIRSAKGDRNFILHSQSQRIFP